MRLTVLALALSGCCFTPTPAPASTAPAAPPVSAAAPSGPGAPGCPDLPTMFAGSWSHEGLVEEYRADGVYVINGVSGNYRFSAPGHLVLDEPSSGLHAEYDVGLVDATTMVGINDQHVALTYTRTSPPPAIPPSCLDFSTSFVRTWQPRPSGTPEVYAADGTFHVVASGRWAFTSPGHLLLTGDDGTTTDYLVAMPDHATMLAVRAGQGLAYDAAP